MRFFLEPPGFCCCNGQILIKPVILPDGLVQLLSGQSDISKQFRRYIRLYNNNFAYTSMGVNYDRSLTSRSHCGIYTFRVCGQIHHYLQDLQSNSDSKIGLELYFYDPEHELQNRLSTSDELNLAVMQCLMGVMAENPYAVFLRSLNKVPDLHKYYISINCSSMLDQRTYNCPASSDVAAIWLENDDCSNSKRFERDIRISTKAGCGYAIREHYSCYDTLQYPLMFPRGEPGWHPNIFKLSTAFGQLPAISTSCTNYSSVFQVTDADETWCTETGPKVSARQYYCYRLQIRPADLSFQLSFGRLTQQFVVDMYIKIETMRLSYIRGNQQKFRIDFYQGIVDSVAIGFQRGNKIGKRIFLPASFIGGPRDMRKRYVDAMALVRKFGKPDVFLTMTCNANWPEIKKNLAKYEEVQNRPDLVSRVFRAKVEIMKKRLTVDKVFGEVASLIYVVEYQKRGLPHAHFLLILKASSKLHTPEAYDRVVSAELPDKYADPSLHSVVARHMFHGPCGILNPTNVCMQRGVCKNKYPKEYCEHTVHGRQTYPQYRRRETSLANAVKVGKHMLDNRWVIPYNPRLLREFNCHMNVEVCGDIRAVKYLYKYVYKGVDKVSMKIVDQADESIEDEISNYQSARWISPPEAVWRIFSFNLCGAQPSVFLLQIHLPNFQTVTFADDADLQQVVGRDSVNKTMLTEFFSVNASSRSVNEECFYYKDFPDHFRWNSTRKQWTWRKRGDVVGRLASVNPSEGERYYLRLLLLNVKGPISYDDLLLVDGRFCGTFRESAYCRGLLLTDSTFETALEEAASYQLPCSLRVLFATILAFCDLANPAAMYQRFFDDLTDDFRRQAFIDDEPTFHMEQQLLQDLDRTLETVGKSINTFNLANIQIYRDPTIKSTREIRAECDIPISTEDLASIEQLNTVQRLIYDEIINDVYQSKPAVYFVDGPGGTGKTFLYKALLAKVRSCGHIAIATASSGIASTLLPGGRTAHSRFGIPIASDQVATPNISKASSSGLLLIRCKLIVWDEAPMMNRFAIEGVNTMLQDFCETSALFGGKVVVFGGDFRQTLPIVQGGNRTETVDATIVKSHLWPNFSVRTLTKNMRAQADPEFAAYLMRVGNGVEPQTSCGRIKIPEEMIIPYIDDASSLQALIDIVYPDLLLFKTHPAEMCLRAILTPKNDAVHHINDILIEQFPGDIRIYKSIDRAVSNQDEAHYTDFLNELTPTGMPRHLLQLKLGCPVVLLRNMNPHMGFANGTRLICKSLDPHVIGVEIVTGQFKGTHGFIPRIKHMPREGEKYIIPFTRQQFPLRLAFAMTINKAQGQTLEFVGLYLRQPVFTHGQLYVALSRGKSKSAVKVLIGPPTDSEQSTDLTTNEVFTEVLQMAAMKLH